VRGLLSSSPFAKANPTVREMRRSWFKATPGKKTGQVCWYTLIIPAVKEAEVEGSQS
jgi:hypothetical protein